MNRTILRWVVYGGLFIVPFIPFFVSSSFFFPFITTKAFTFRIIVEIVIAAWALLALSEPEYRPKKSWISWALLAFLVVVALADAFGLAPVKSFWSNFERMEGFVTLLHLGAYFIVLGSFFSEVDWRRWWKTSLFASLLMVFYTLFQLAGKFAIHQGGARIDGTFGNAEYLAAYMLIHIFVAFYYFVQEKSSWWKWFLWLVIIADAFALYESATRGAIIGLLGGLLVAALLSITNRQSRSMRRAGLAYVVLFILLIAGFFAFRTSSFVTKSPTLDRFATISLSELSGEGRAYVWPMAVKGIEERPILGWGQDNFNYVFDEQYSPKMFALEPWFDRAHNIFLDWGISAGVLGLLAYLSLYAAFLYLVWGKGERFNRSERAVLTGLLAAYFFNNFFVFDNLTSYTLFFALLAYVHFRAPKAEPRRAVKAWSESDVLSTALPVAIILVGVVIYFANIRPMVTNASLIDGLSTVQSKGDMHVAVASLEKAYGESRLGRPEVVEQIASAAPTILQSSGLSTAEKNDFYSFAKQAVLEQADRYPGDTRYQILAGSFLSVTGDPTDALTYLERAKAITPGKQDIYFEIASADIEAGKTAEAEAVLKAAYDLEPADTEAELAYTAGAIYAGDRATEASLEADLLGRPEVKSSLLDSRLLGAYVAAKRYSDLVTYLEKVEAAYPDLKSAADQYITQAKSLE